MENYLDNVAKLYNYRDSNEHLVTFTGQCHPYFLKDMTYWIDFEGDMATFVLQYYNESSHRYAITDDPDNWRWVEVPAPNYTAAEMYLSVCQCVQDFAQSDEGLVWGIETTQVANLNGGVLASLP